MSKRCLGCMEQFGNEYEVCPYCGYIIGTQADEAIHITPGSILQNRYIIGRVLGYGGFGVTYIGWDKKLEQKVAIKEYLPSEFSTRMPGQSHITVFNGEKGEQFYDGMHKFIEEAKHLAKFKNETGIVKIFDSFEENGTAYIIMEYLDGETLTSYLKNVGTITEDDAVEMLMPVMQSLQVVHDEGLLHRDIAPDNIFITKTGEIKLIDFGASRYATTSHSRSLTVIIKPGYSPEEQYRSRGDQGPHTDVYALAATLYKMITGITPPDAMERRAKLESQNKEMLVEPHKIKKGISINRENAILNAMNVRIEDRTPDIAAFMHDLNADKPVKRIYGQIKKIDIYSWPLWLKITVPFVLCMLIAVGVLMFTGIIQLPHRFSDEVVVPEGIVIVPEFEGMEQGEAWQLAKNSLINPIAGEPIESDFITPGKIVLQDPNVGAYLEQFGNVTLFVSAGTIKEGYIPSCIGFSLEDALKRLTESGYSEPEIEYEYSEVDEGKVIRQSPEADTQADKNTKITLIVSKGAAPFAMPNLVGQSSDQAKQVLLEKGRNLETVTFTEEFSDAPIGTVLRQEPSEGSEVSSGTPVTVVVSAGKESLTVDEVIGKPENEAKAVLESKGFKVSVSTEYSEVVESGYVISQTPAPGEMLFTGDTVTIQVSLGSAYRSVENVVGETQSNAVSRLESQGLTVIVNEEYSETVESGKVVSQSPNAGETVHIGDTMTIQVSLGKKPISVENVVGKTQSNAVSILESQKFNVTVVEEFSNSVLNGDVIRQDPAAGTTAFANDTVTITVSKGRQAKTIGSGTCGDGIIWVFTDDGCLTISGNGKMDDYKPTITWDESYWNFEYDENPAPWDGYCELITSVNIFNGVKRIGKQAFEGCVNLTSINIPNTLTSIGSRAFAGCSKLTSIIIPDSVVSIGTGAFSNCRSITSISLPKRINEFWPDVFEYCSNLTSIYIPSGMPPMESYVFYECTSLTSIYYEGSAEQWKSISEDLVLPSGATVYYNSKIN